MSEKVPTQTQIGHAIPKREDLQRKEKKWDRVKRLIENEENTFGNGDFCWQLPNESDVNYSKRCKIFPNTMVNMSQDLISAAPSAVFKNGIDQKFDNSNSMLSTFAEDVTIGNEDPTPMIRYMRDFIGVGLRSYGTTFTVIDKPRVNVKSRLQERVAGMPYLNNIHPLDVINYEFVNGELLWLAYSGVYRMPWTDPRQPMPKAKSMVYVWNKTNFIALENGSKLVPELSYTHGWGFVPIIIQSSFLASPNDILGQAAFEQTSHMILAYNNSLNQAYWELMKHGGALLLINEDSITGANFGTDRAGETELKKQAKGAALTYAGESKPEYLIKDLAVEEIMNMAMFYAKAAADNERDQKSVVKKGGDGVDISESGIAKIVDREPIEANLVALAEDIETWAAKTYDIVSKILNVENDASIEFDKEYDMRPFNQKIEETKKLMREVGYGKITPTGMKIQIKTLTPEITADLNDQAIVNAEVDSSDIGQEDEALDNAVANEIKNTEV